MQMHCSDVARGTFRLAEAVAFTFPCSLVSLTLVLDGHPYLKGGREVP